MRALWTFAFVSVLLGAASWLGWHYVQFRACGARTCPPLAGREPVPLGDGRELSLVGLRSNERGHLVIDYRTQLDRSDRKALCEEARALWEALRPELDRPRLERVLLGPTQARSEFLGMRYGVVPLYTCCVTTPVRADKGRDGRWHFDGCVE